MKPMTSFISYHYNILDLNEDALIIFSSHVKKAIENIFLLHGKFHQSYVLLIRTNKPEICLPMKF